MRTKKHYGLWLVVDDELGLPKEFDIEQVIEQGLEDLGYTVSQVIALERYEPH